MKLHSLVPISTFMYLGAIYIFPRLVLFEISITLKTKKKLTTRINCFHLWSVIKIGNLYVDHLCELLAQPQERWGEQGTAANHCLVTLPCPSLHSSGWAESSLTQYSKIFSSHSYSSRGSGTIPTTVNQQKTAKREKTAERMHQQRRQCNNVILAKLAVGIINGLLKGL